MKKEIIKVCAELYQKGLLAGADGNISVRKGAKVFITPSGVSKRSLNEKDICLMNLKGTALKGRPSSEKLMHLAIYNEQKKAGAVVHAHPPFAVSLSVARRRWKRLPPVLSESVITLGDTPFAPYTCPGAKQTAEALRPFLTKSRALILRRHGAVTWGENLESAFLTMEILEHSAQIIYMAEVLGGSAPLKGKDLRELEALHKKLRSI